MNIGKDFFSCGEGRGQTFVVFKFVLCPLIERVLIFIVIGHHTIDIPEISYVFTVFTVSEFADGKFRFFVRVKCYRHV